METIGDRADQLRSLIEDLGYGHQGFRALLTAMHRALATGAAPFES